MAERRFPRPDGDFAAYMNHYYVAVEKFWSDQGLDPADLNALKEARTAWNAAYPAHVAAQNAAEGARQAKDAARRALEAQARPVTAFIQGYPKTTDADRATIGITIRDTGGTPVPPPTTRPQALVQSGQRLTHTLRLTDESTPTRRARPRGVLGAEVWVKLVAPGAGQRGEGAGHPAPGAGEGGGAGVSSGPVPHAPSQVPGFSFLTLATKASIRADFRAGDGGKTAVYMARWVNTQGEKGPWSEVTTATVAA